MLAKFWQHPIPAFGNVPEKLRINTNQNRTRPFTRGMLYWLKSNSNPHK
ncbi:hypothetical protein H6G54_10865 [Anabaena cylindrica FACHB-243]|nr:hypothetical protein [Anabaena cylindrica]MBD2418198.1 hypothetical protein [Anabaena cylindrica FACHB-243]MCM2409080.1 hypothetical protein [Anabaena sp. CCAP 1446/1C]